jgi:YidC/Oxa1 family membrane protein insertase
MLIWMPLVTLVWLSYTTYLEDQAIAFQLENTASRIDISEIPISDFIPSLPSTNVAEAGALDIANTNTSNEELLISVETDDLILDFGIAGDVVGASLKQFPIDKDRPDELMVLLERSEQNRYVLQTGFRASGYSNEPTHQSRYELVSRTNNQGSWELTFRQDGDGYTAEKIYHIPSSGFIVDFNLVMTNLSNEPHAVMPYTQIRRTYNPAGRSYLDVDSYSFWGPAWYLGEQFEKIEVNDIEQNPDDYLGLIAIDNGWVAAIQHHFLTAIIPQGQSNYSVAMQGEDFILTNTLNSTEIGLNESMTYSAALFVGPKLQSEMQLVSPELRLAVDYGLLSFIAQPLFWLLRWVYGFLGNWGMAIIFVTLIIKASFYKLTAKAGMSMAKMRNVQPRLKALQERYKDDRQALSTAMMGLYKKEKINPAAGCLPMIIQMPFFFAFYWVLIESVELRQAPFFLWVDDLSTRDPFFILPLINCLAMVMQMRLQPAPADPMQARVMKIMPIVFSAMFAFFPSGLVLYWTTNALFSIVQQWRINKSIANVSLPLGGG